MQFTRKGRISLASKVKRARMIIEKSRAENRISLTEYESKSILRIYGIPTTTGELANNQEEAAIIAERIGFPVVLKVSSPDITHKTEVGGVRIGLNDKDEVRQAFNEIIQSAKKKIGHADIPGILVENMAPQGVEVIVGMKDDPQFGPVIMFGLGGVLVEILKDVSFRLAPITRREALEMIREVKGYPILLGYKGDRPADLAAISEIIIRVSKMSLEIPELKEVDINPILAYERGAVAVDARMIIK